MGVYGYSFCFVVGSAEDDVGGFSCYAFEFDELFHGVGDFSVVLLDYCLCCGLDGFCFSVVEAAASDVVDELVSGGVGVVGCGSVFFEEGFCDFVDLFVGALC